MVQFQCSGSPRGGQRRVADKQPAVPGRRLVLPTAWLLAIAALGGTVQGSGAQRPEPSPIAWFAPYDDYAPHGMPDFSQCRGPWSQPGSPPQWTHAAPVALADVLWWLDSAAESSPAPPTQANDHCPLVTAYPHFGPPIDDHSPENVGPLVEDLAQRANTNGQRDSRASRGTAWQDLVAAVPAYLSARHLEDSWLVRATVAPDPAWLREQVASDAGVVLLLGVWEDQAGTWRRVGGHYAALAGIDSEGNGLALADPLADMAVLSHSGRTEPSDPQVHSCRTAPRAHDDAAVVSLDGWSLTTGELPEGLYVLEGYFSAANYGEAAAFRDQNAIAAFAHQSGSWQRGPVVMALDAGLAMVPAAPRTPADPPTATATAQPTAPAWPSASSLPPATATPAPASPTAGASPPPASTPHGSVALRLPLLLQRRPAPGPAPGPAGR